MSTLSIKKLFPGSPEPAGPTGASVFGSGTVLVSMIGISCPKCADGGPGTDSAPIVDSIERRPIAVARTNCAVDGPLGSTPVSSSPSAASSPAGVPRWHVRAPAQLELGLGGFFKIGTMSVQKLMQGPTMPLHGVGTVPVAATTCNV